MDDTSRDATYVCARSSTTMSVTSENLGIEGTGRVTSDSTDTRHLNFNVPVNMYASSDSSDQQRRRPSSMRDPLSHRIIEKRRRDRMNNCLSDLSQLIPRSYIKQGQGRIEKTEIIEMATRYIESLQRQIHDCEDKFKNGFDECRDEVMRYLVENQGYDAADGFCTNLLHHLYCQLRKLITSRDSYEQHQMDSTENRASKIKTFNNSSPDGYSGPDLGKRSTSRENRGWTSGSNSPDDSSKTQESPDGSSTYGDGSGNAAWTTDSMESGRMDGQSWTDSGASASPGINSSNSSGTPDIWNGLNMNMNSNKRPHGSYKFKSDIKKRFHSEKGSSEGSSDNSFGSPGSAPPEEHATTSEELKTNDLWGRSRRGHSSLWSSETSGIGSSASNTGGDTSQSATPQAPGSKQSNFQDRNGNIAGFALHPSGLFYIPVALPVAPLLSSFKNYSGIGICHPISIPVHFGGN